MSYTAQPTAPGAGNPLADAFVQTMLDNIAFLKSEADALRGLGMRQRVQSTALGGNVTITSTSQTDVTGLSLDITTTGGRLKIYMVPSTTDAEQAGIKAFVASGTPDRAAGFLRAVVGSTSLTSVQYGSNDVDPEVDIPPSSWEWHYTPSSGTYTVKLQARTLTNIQLVFGTGIRLVCEEWGT